MALASQSTRTFVRCKRALGTAPGRPVRLPSSEESGAPGAEPGAWWVWTAMAPVAPSQGWPGPRCIGSLDLG
jgi:hypothetical protein